MENGASLTAVSRTVRLMVNGNEEFQDTSWNVGLFAGENWSLNKTGKRGADLLRSEQISNTDLKHYSFKGARIKLDSFVRHFPTIRQSAGIPGVTQVSVVREREKNPPNRCHPGWLWAYLQLCRWGAASEASHCGKGKDFTKTIQPVAKQINKQITNLRG